MEELKCVKDWRYLVPISTVKQFLLYVIESPKPYEKLEKLKAWTDDHINKAFTAVEITDSEVQCEFLFAREIK